jgi:hypothetical protein
MGKSIAKLLKTNRDNMPVFRLSTMLMKTNELNSSFHDVDEKKWSYRCHVLGVRGQRVKKIGPSGCQKWSNRVYPRGELGNANPGREGFRYENVQDVRWDFAA